MLRWRCKLWFSTVKPQLYCFGLFLLFTEYFKTTYLTLASELIFFFLCYVHQKRLNSI